MRLPVDDEFRRLCRDVTSRNRTVEEWRERESDDEFQSANYVGGYDATEDAFAFSRYEPSGAEWWFQLTLDELRAVADGDDPNITMRPAEGA